MEPMDYWRLCEELTVKQAALLIAGTEPSEAVEYIDRWKPEDRPVGYDAAVHAIHRALKKGTIAGELVQLPLYDRDGEQYGVIESSIDLDKSMVEVESVRDFLAARGFSSGFFASLSKAKADYLNPKHPRYASKLAAAVSAWLAVTDVNGQSPKQALEKWLREHAAEFALSDDEGKPNETGIMEASKVANWRPGGGAPKTPG